MKGNKKWLAILAIAMSIPSTIAGLALLVNELVEKGLVDIKIGFVIFLLVILGMLWLMVSYAFNRKN